MLLSVWLTAVMMPVCSSAQPPSAPATQELYQTLKAAGVEVLVDGRLAGSGTLVDDGTYVLTAAHVLGKPRRQVEIRLADSRRVQAHLVALDRGHDVVLLRYEPAAHQAAPLALAEKSPPAGEPVFLFGAPMFRHQVMMRGTVARDSATFEFCNHHMIRAIHINGDSPVGTSGGPWVNAQGELIGIQSSLINNGRAPIGLAVVAPLASLRRLVETKQSANTATLGTAVEEMWGQDPAFLRAAKVKTGLVVRQLQGQGPAAKAGLREWDIILKTNGQAYDRVDSFMQLVRSQSPGEVVTLEVVDRHGDNPRRLTIRLESLEQAWLQAASDFETKSRRR